MDKLEEAKKKLLNMEDLTEEDIKALEDHYTPEELNDLLDEAEKTFFKKEISEEELLNTVQASLLGASSYISKIIGSDANMSKISTKAIKLLTSLQIFTANFISCSEDILSGEEDKNSLDFHR